MAMKKGALVREGGEVGLGSAAADSVVGRSPGWREPGSVEGVRVWERGRGRGEKATWLSRKVGRVRVLCSLCILWQED